MSVSDIGHYRSSHDEANVITHHTAYREILRSSFLSDSCVIAMRTIVFYDQSFSSRDIMVTVGNVFAATESVAYSIRGFDHYPRHNTQIVRLSTRTLYK